MQCSPMDPVWRRGGPSPPDWLATPSQLVDFAVMRELCLGAAVFPSQGTRLQGGTPQATTQHGELRGRQSCDETSALLLNWSSHQQLVNWGYTTAHRGVTQGVCAIMPKP